jgi:hypothetical protein
MLPPLTFVAVELPRRFQESSEIVYINLSVVIRWDSTVYTSFLLYTSITVIDIGYHTFKIRYRSGRPLLGHFREGSRKVQKIGVGRYQQFHPVILAPAVLYDIDYYY